MLTIVNGLCAIKPPEVVESGKRVCQLPLFSRSPLLAGMIDICAGNLAHWLKCSLNSYLNLVSSIAIMLVSHSCVKSEPRVNQFMFSSIQQIFSRGGTRVMYQTKLQRTDKETSFHSLLSSSPTCLQKKLGLIHVSFTFALSHFFFSIQNSFFYLLNCLIFRFAARSQSRNLPPSSSSGIHQGSPQLLQYCKWYHILFFSLPSIAVCTSLISKSQCTDWICFRTIPTLK